MAQATREKWQRYFAQAHSRGQNRRTEAQATREKWQRFFAQAHSRGQNRRTEAHSQVKNAIEIVEFVLLRPTHEGKIAELKPTHEVKNAIENVEFIYNGMERLKQPVAIIILPGNIKQAH